MHPHFVFLRDPATTAIYTLSLHDALPISDQHRSGPRRGGAEARPRLPHAAGGQHHRRQDRKSTRLNSSHANISYAVFCLKKKTISGLRIAIETEEFTTRA